MRVAAITRLKHGRIWELLRKLNWSQAELAKRSGLLPSQVGRCINLRGRPTVNVAQKIQNAFGEAGEFLDILEEWPESFVGINPGTCLEQISDVDIEMIADSIHPQMIEAPDGDFQVALEGCRNVLDGLLGELNPRQLNVLKLRFKHKLTLEQIAEEFGCTSTRIRQLESQAIRKLRKPQVLRSICPVTIED